MAQVFRHFKKNVFPALALFLYVSCGGGGGPDAEEKGSSSLFKKALQKTQNVTTYVAAAREVPLVITEDGKTEASDRYQAKAPANVKVQKVFVEEGARVSPGDPLVKFSDETLPLRLNLARAEVREAEAGLATTNGSERPQPREQTPASSASQDQTPEESAEAAAAENVNINEARAALYQAQLERARAEVELYERLTELDQLNSPIAGIAGRPEVGEGSEAVEDQVLIEIVKLDPIYFTFSLPPDQVPYLERGSEIGVKLAAYPGQDFTGEVASVGSDANGGNGGVGVKLRIPNPDLTIKSDLKGVVEIRTTGRRKIVSVPESAIVRSERSAYVYKLAGNKAQRVAVDLGTTSGGQVEIEKGLTDGETVIVAAEDGMEALSDGAPVEVQATRAEK